MFGEHDGPEEPSPWLVRTDEGFLRLTTSFYLVGVSPLSLPSTMSVGDGRGGGVRPEREVYVDLTDPVVEGPLTLGREDTFVEISDTQG